MSAAGFFEISGQGSEGCTLCSFFFIFVLHPLNRAARCTGSCGLGGVLLRATASFDKALLIGSGRFNTVITGNVYHFRDDGKLAEFRINVVKGQPDFCAPGDAGGFDAADVAVNLRAGR